MDTNHPFFSVIIVYWNNNQTIDTCLESLSKQIDQDFEILLIDNGSSEPIPDKLFQRFSRLPIRSFRIDQNTGFTGGNNFGATRAKGDYLVLLNADAFPRPDWLEKIREGIQRHPQSFFASKQIMANNPDRLDGAGDIYHASGLAWRNFYNTRITRIKDEEKQVFSACAAAAAYPRHAFERVNGFDEDYFSYVEDIDLGFRLRLIGYRCIYLPEAVVDHVGFGSTSKSSYLAAYYGHRNLVWTYIKDMPGAFVWILAPFHVAVTLLIMLRSILKHQGIVALKAKWDALLLLPAILKKRKNVQRTVTVSAMKVLQAMDWNPLSPVIKLFIRIK